MILIQLLAGMGDQTLSIEIQQKRDLTLNETLQRMRMKDIATAEQVQDSTVQGNVKESQVTIERKRGEPPEADIQEVLKYDSNCSLSLGNKYFVAMEYLNI